MNNKCFQNPYEAELLPPGDSVIRTTVMISERAKSRIASVHARSGTLQTTINILLDKLIHELERIKLTSYDPDAYELAVGQCTIIFGPTGDEAYDKHALHFTNAFDAQNRGGVSGTGATEASGLGEQTGGQGGSPGYNLTGTNSGRVQSVGTNLSSLPRSSVPNPEPHGQAPSGNEPSGTSDVARGASVGGVEPRDSNGAPADQRPAGSGERGPQPGRTSGKSKKKVVSKSKGPGTGNAD